MGELDTLELSAHVAFADISGFSGLANELLQRLGSEGAAELARHLDLTFTRLVGEVHARGGEVVRFAGDALVAWWPEEQGDAAAAAAAALQQVPLPAGLELRVGLGSGRVTAQRLGGREGRFELVLTGPAVREACGGGVVPAVEEPAVTPYRAEEVRPEYVPDFVERRARRPEPWLAELRQVTALFVALPALDQATVRCLQDCAAAHFGVLDKVVHEDKGPVALLLFGLPAALAPFRPEHALRCALALRERGLVGGMGVSTGKVFAGPVGPLSRREYAVVGSSLNLAARLMQEAGQRLLSDRSTARLSPRVRFGEEHTLELKGFDDPVPVLEVLGAPEGPFATATRGLAGREVEIRALAETLGADQDATLVFEGEAGIGKSRLLALAVEGSDEAPLMVVGDAVQRGTPWYAWRLAMRAILGDASSAMERLQDHPDLQELHPLLGQVLGAEVPDTALTAGLKGFVRAGRTMDLMVELLRRANPGGGTLLVEDAHWLDQASMALLARLRGRLQPLRLIIATRPEVDPTPAWQSLTSGARTLQLRALDRVGIRLLLQERVGTELPPSLVSWVLEHGDGNPFFALELVAGLQESGRLVVEEGVLARVPDDEELAAFEPPATVEGAVTWRIDALDPVAQAVVKTASVLGASFALGELLEVHPDSSQVEPALRELLRAGLLEHKGELRFSHVIVRDVAYARMPLDQRRQLHARAAAALEAQPEALRRGRMPLLAWHWATCDEDRALEALEWCWHDARREGAMHEAYRSLVRADELERGLRERGEPGATRMRRAGWQRRMAAAVAGVGAPVAIHDHAEQALVLLERPPPKDPGGWKLAALKALLLRGWQVVAPRSIWQAQEDRANDRAEEAMAWTRLAEAHFYLKSNPLAMLTSALSAVNAARASGRVVPVTTAWGQLGLVAGSMGMDRLALSCVAEARAIADDLGEPTEQSNAWLGYVVVHSLSCRWEACEGVLESILPLLRASRNAHLVGPFYSLLACNDYLQGRYQRARDRALELRESALEVRNELQLGWSNYHLAQIALALGDHETALEHGLQAVEQLQRRGDLAELVALGVVARVHARRGDRQAASAVLEDLEGKLPGASVNSYTRLEGHAGAAEAWLELGDKARAEAALPHLAAFSKRFRCGRPRLTLLQGLIRDSPAQLEKARAQAADYGLRLDEARALAALGRTDEARASFARLRCRWNEEQLDA